MFGLKRWVLVYLVAVGLMLVPALGSAATVKTKACSSQRIQWPGAKTPIVATVCSKPERLLVVAPKTSRVLFDSAHYFRQYGCESDGDGGVNISLLSLGKTSWSKSDKRGVVEVIMWRETGGEGGEPYRKFKVKAHLVFHGGKIDFVPPKGTQSSPGSEDETAFCKKETNGETRPSLPSTILKLKVKGGKRVKTKKRQAFVVPNGGAGWLVGPLGTKLLLYDLRQKRASNSKVSTCTDCCFPDPDEEDSEEGTSEVEEVHSMKLGKVVRDARGRIGIRIKYKVTVLVYVGNDSDECDSASCPRKKTMTGTLWFDVPRAGNYSCAVK